MSLIDVFYYSHLATQKAEILFNAVAGLSGSLIAIEVC